jgi:SAM-dependent methyltransferase
MTTIPPQQAPPPQGELHQAREVAESFGSDAERYDRTRPSYPPALVARIVAESPGRDVLDVGCGTGIAARQFQAAGCRVLGVDPDARMAEIARQSGLDVDVATIESWDPAGREFDAVVAAQAWHWVDPVAAATKVARALRPGGRLAVFWNAFQPPPGLGEAFQSVYSGAMPGAPGFWTRPIVELYLKGCGTTADAIRQTGAFDEPQQWRFDWERHYTRDEWLDQVPTFGGSSLLPPARLEELLAGIGAAVDAVGGSFTMQYATVAVSATRAGTR